MIRKKGKTSSFRILDNGNLEVALGFAFILLSLTTHAITAGNLISELLVLAAIPLLRFYPPASLLPLVGSMGLWAAGFTDHVLLSGIIICLAVEYAIASRKIGYAVIISTQWIVLAYVISPSTGNPLGGFSEILFEISLLAVGAIIGYTRLHISLRLSKSHEAKMKRDLEMRARLANYLHDSVSRSLTAIAMKADGATEPESTSASRARLDDIAVSARKSILELHQLVDQLQEATSETTIEILENNHAIPIKHSLSSARDTLVGSGFTVSCTDTENELLVKPDVESAFSLALSEISTNILKHALPNSTVRFEPHVTEHSFLNISFINDIDYSGRRPQPGSGMGLPSIHNRLSVVGGSFLYSADHDHWTASISIPLTIDRTQYND